MKDWREKKYCGRTPAGWGLCCLFYLVLYCCLAGYFSTMMFFYFTYIVDKVTPRHELDESLLSTPGMGLKPKFTNDSTLIYFERSNTSHVHRIEKKFTNFLEAYHWSNQIGDNFIDCDKGKAVNDSGKVCQFRSDWLGPCNYIDGYGYEDGEPCIILRLNKVFRWMPENYELDNVPDEIRGVWKPNIVTVTCQGADPVSDALIGHIDYYPMQGWSFDYYPYLNQKGYVSPLVAVQFLEITSGVLIFVECKAWAKNIVHDEEFQLGQVNFEFLAD